MGTPAQKQIDAGNDERANRALDWIEKTIGAAKGGQAAADIPEAPTTVPSGIGPNLAKHLGSSNGGAVDPSQKTDVRNGMSTAGRGIDAPLTDESAALASIPKQSPGQAAMTAASDVATGGFDAKAGRMGAAMADNPQSQLDQAPGGSFMGPAGLDPFASMQPQIPLDMQAGEALGRAYNSPGPQAQEAEHRLFNTAGHNDQPGAALAGDITGGLAQIFALEGLGGGGPAMAAERRIPDAIAHSAASLPERLATSGARGYGVGGFQGGLSAAGHDEDIVEGAARGSALGAAGSMLLESTLSPALRAYGESKWEGMRGYGQTDLENNYAQVNKMGGEPVFMGQTLEGDIYPNKLLQGPMDEAKAGGSTTKPSDIAAQKAAPVVKERIESRIRAGKVGSAEERDSFFANSKDKIDNAPLVDQLNGLIDKQYAEGTEMVPNSARADAIAEAKARFEEAKGLRDEGFKRQAKDRMVEAKRMMAEAKAMAGEVGQPGKVPLEGSHVKELESLRDILTRVPKMTAKEFSGQLKLIQETINPGPDGMTRASTGLVSDLRRVAHTMQEMRDAKWSTLGDIANKAESSIQQAQAVNQSLGLSPNLEKFNPNDFGTHNKAIASALKSMDPDTRKALDVLAKDDPALQQMLELARGEGALESLRGQDLQIPGSTKAAMKQSYNVVRRKAAGLKNIGPPRLIPGAAASMSPEERRKISEGEGAL